MSAKINIQKLSKAMQIFKVQIFCQWNFFFFQFLILEKQVLPEQKKNFFYLDPPPGTSDTVIIRYSI